MNAAAIIINRLDAANDPTWPPEPPARLTAPAAVDPAVQAWASDFDAWLDTPAGAAWLEDMEGSRYARAGDNGSYHPWEYRT